MTKTRRLDMEALHRDLRCSLRYGGVRASRLLHYTPDLIELLYPMADYPQLNAYDRAIQTEVLIRQAVDSIGGNAGHALAVILCLPSGTLSRKLDERRSIAANYLGIQPETFRRHRHEQRLLYDLAVEIYRLHSTNTEATNDSKPNLNAAGR